MLSTQENNFKDILSDKALNGLLFDRLRLSNKRKKTDVDKLLLGETNKKLNKVFKKVSGELCKYPYNVLVALLAMSDQNIAINNYVLQNDVFSIYINKFENLYSELGKIINILYNDVFVRDGNKIKKTYLYIQNINDESRIIIMQTDVITKFMKKEITVNDFSKLCRVC